MRMADLSTDVTDAMHNAMAGNQPKFVHNPKKYYEDNHESDE